MCGGKSLAASKHVAIVQVKCTKYINFLFYKISQFGSFKYIYFIFQSFLLYSFLENQDWRARENNFG